MLQYVEGLSDRQAADAVRARIDWKYALGLELTDPGFDHTVLSEFLRLVHGQAEQQLLDTLLEKMRERKGLIRQRGRGLARLMSWPRSARSIGWSGSARRCGPP